MILLVLPSIALAQGPLSKENAFVADEHPEVAAFFEGRDDSPQILDALVDAGGNWRNLYEAIEYFEDEMREDCIYLVKIMPHLDRLEMTKDILVEHVEYAWSAKSEFAYSIPDEMFQEYILVFRLGDEPITPYRAILHERFSHLAGTTPSETAKAVNEWIYENIEVKPRGFFGPRPSPISILNVGVGTQSDIANLTSAVLKTLGVPSRGARIRSFGQQADGAAWVEIYDNGWVPLYPDSPGDFGDFGRWERDKPRNVTVVSAQSAFHTTQVTPSYTDVGVIELKFIKRGEVNGDFEHFGFAVYNSGGFMPLDDLGFDLEESRMTTGEEDIFEAVLGDGTYLVQCGVRNYKGDPWVQTRMVELKAGERVCIEFNVDPPLGDLTPKDLVKRKIKETPEFRLDDLDYPSDLEGTPHLIVFFNLKNEPAVRMLPEIIRFANEHPELTLELIHSGAPDETEDAENAVDDAGGDSLEILWDDFGDAAKAWKCPYNEEEDRFTSFPTCIIVDEHGTIVLYDEGYNLIIYDYLTRGLEFIQRD